MGVKHTFTNGEQCKGWSLMTPKCTPTLGHSCKSPKCSEPWLEMETNTKLGPFHTIGKVLNCRYLKCPWIVHLDLIWMRYDQKKGQKSNWEFDSWPQIPFEKRSNNLQLGHAIHHWKDLFQGYKIVPSHAPNMIFKGRHEHPKSFETTRVPIFRILLESPRKKCHLNVAPMESHKIYYREGSDASSQSLRAM